MDGNISETLDTFKKAPAMAKAILTLIDRNRKLIEEKHGIFMIGRSLFLTSFSPDENKMVTIDKISMSSDDMCITGADFGKIPLSMLEDLAATVDIW